MVNETSVVQSNQVRSCALSSYLRWNSHSKELLDESETQILSNVKSTYETKFVPIGDCVGYNDEIWTLSANKDSTKTPLVLVHGFAAGLAFWLQNLDAFAQKRPVYAVDLLGFGKSSRSPFSHDAETIETQFCDSIERWRQAMQIPKMILLGHSFGGFLSTSYATRYPEHVEHLILADPWGFNERPDLSDRPLWQKSLIRVFGKVPPLGIVRAAGPFGEWLIGKARKDIMAKYENVLDDHRIIARYIHQCNSNSPTGELAFKRLLDNGPWAKYPMGERMKENFSKHIPVTFLYGEKTWMKTEYGEIIKNARGESYTRVEFVKDAGHHVYADNPEDFNNYVVEACEVLKSQLEEI